MSIKNIINNLFKKNNAIESDESYCYTKIIWNDRHNLMMLISFTKDYFDEIIELQDAINNSWQPLHSKIVYSSYEKEAKESDDFVISIRIIHNKYYMLIGGSPHQWEELYMRIHNLGNNILDQISKEITNNCLEEDFKHLVEDGILRNFKNEDPDFDIPLSTDKGLYYTNPMVVLERLPEAFTGRDVIKFITIFTSSITTNAYSSLLDITNTALTTPFLDPNYDANKRFKNHDLYHLYTLLFKNPTVEKLAMLLEPLYKQPDDDSIPGDVSDESLDEIFREHYERFSAVADDNTHYEDIDEELSDDEDYENINEEDDN